ncbi:MAG TPA: PDDEXK nuclease domain-containing protein [Treponemataceae bacterium]|nr:PDDEXK nuclease domain-containing protein [Treponemataceae bacterium]HOQ92788.1 PDDEXK nuclease domain-containing protein [Treponemataceae bacterium]HPM05417.1 PDDEXK nuclease domain-containing protein [Treponemataceae bacterium]
MKFDDLIVQIQEVSKNLQQQAVKAVNVSLTLRNWLIGFYIVEFEQNGEDRAQYGDRLLERIAETIQIKGLGITNLKWCRIFYQNYPQIIQPITQMFDNPIFLPIRQSITDELQSTKNQMHKFHPLPIDECNKSQKHIQHLLNHCSFTHFIELIKIDDAIKRKFYEMLILKTTPSIKELKRSIESLTYERFGLSENKEKALQKIINKIQPQSNTDLIKSHYFFEFLNISHPELIEESDLEQALITHLQQFITELGNGFCFENRQKRILIGDEYYFIDLVFYHRILKCHVLIELKTEAVKHEHIGQLKTYLNYYKKNIQEPNDNPPVAILLITEQNKALVEYAIADADKDLFVSKYQLQLPRKEEIEKFITNELKRLKNE